jgi:hypothetical protein
MSEEVQTEVERNPLQDMIQHAIDQNFNKANDVFNDMITIKMSDLLDQEKVNMADQIYNGVEPDEEDDQLELDLEAESSSEEEEEENWEESGSGEEEELEDDNWEEASFEDDENSSN